MYHDLPFALPANARLYARDSAGLFVGVRDFERGELAPVRFAVDDAVDLAHLFALELGLIDPAKTVVLLTGEPEKEESRRRLEALLAVGGLREHPWPHAIYHHLFRLGQLTAAEGLMIASFATHGFSDQGKALLAPAGTLRRRLVHTGLPLELVLDDLGRSLAEKRLLLVDACRERFEGATRSAGEALEPFGEAFLQAMDASRGCAFLAGASQGGFAFDDPSRGNGVFTGALLDGLRGEVEGDDEALVTVAALATFAHQRVKDWVRQNKPQYAGVSLGISSSFDPESMRGLPLAIDGKRQRARFERQRNESLAQLMRQLGPRDALYQQALTAVEVDRPEAMHFELLREMAEFDGSPRHRRSLMAFLGELNTMEPPHIESLRRSNAETSRELGLPTTPDFNEGGGKTELREEVRMPDLGEEVKEMTVTKVMVYLGDEVADGTPLFEIGTEKFIVEIPSKITGRVKEIKVKLGDKISVGALLVVVEGIEATPRSSISASRAQ